MTLQLSGRTSHAAVRNPLAARLWQIRSGNRPPRPPNSSYRSRCDEHVPKGRHPTCDSHGFVSPREWSGTTPKLHYQRIPIASAKEAAARIEQWTGVKRSPQRVRIFMRTIGMKFRKTAVLPAKADLGKQEEFKKTFGA
jgi:hypothetical protein